MRKVSQGEPSPRANILEGRQGLNQSGGSFTEPDLEQHRPNQPNSPRIGLKTGSRTGLKIGFTTGPELVSPSIPTRVESVSVDPLTPRPWKHQSSHPLDQI